MTALTMALAVATIAFAGEDCTCADAKAANGWCQSCNVGYVAGIRIESFLLFEELDAHGHDIDPARVTCPSCRKAMTEDGICTKCRIGFVAKQAYPSMLAYHLAKGERKAISQLSCETCRENSRSRGWCDRCRLGMVDVVAIRDRESFDAAARAYDTVLAAIKMLERCKVCAVAMVLDGYCPDCKIRYRDGKRCEEEPTENALKPKHGHPHDHDE